MTETREKGKVGRETPVLTTTSVNQVPHVPIGLGQVIAGSVKLSLHRAQRTIVGRVVPVRRRNVTMIMNVRTMGGVIRDQALAIKTSAVRSPQ